MPSTCRAFRWRRSATKPSPSGASGLGVTGLADALIFCRTRYGSPESVALIETWLSTLSHAAYRASVELARRKRRLPAVRRATNIWRGRISRRLPQRYPRRASPQHGIRNALLTSIAPTGTISLFAGNVSSGIEPVFAYSYTPQGAAARRQQARRDGRGLCRARLPRPLRRRRRAAGLFRHRPDAGARRSSGGAGGGAALHRQRRSPRPSMCRPRFPSRISRTSICRPIEQGCKGCTTYRPNEVTGSVLVGRGARRRHAAEAVIAQRRRAGTAAAAARAARERGGVVYMTRPLDRPEVAAGPHLQDQMAGQRPRLLHHHQRHREGRPPPALRGLHQLQEHGSLCLGAGADPHDLGGVPARRRRLLRGGRAEGDVRSARRAMDGRALCALAAGRHRRSDRAAHGRDRLHGAARAPACRRHVRAVADGRAKARRPFLPALRRAPASCKLEGCDTCLSCGYSKCG